MAKNVVYGCYAFIFMLFVLYLIQQAFLKNRPPYLAESIDQPRYPNYNGIVVPRKGNTTLLSDSEFVTSKNKPADDTKWLLYPSIAEKAKFNKTSTKTCQPDTEMTDWSFNCKIICPTLRISTKYKQIQLNCQNATLYTTELNQNISVYVATNVTCLKAVIKTQCLDKKIVPKLVHYIWYTKRRYTRKFELFNFLSFLGASRFIKPCLIIIHGDRIPGGFYWDSLLKIVPNIIFIFRNPPMTIFGKKLTCVEHKADVASLQVLQEFGGIYVDTDEVILRSLDPFRNFPMTMSSSTDNNLAHGLMIAAKHAKFLKLWLNEYKNYSNSEWAYTPTIVPRMLSKLHPDLIHVENRTFVKPNYLELAQIFKGNFNWSKNYAIHIYARFYKKKHNFIDIKYINTTIGSVARYVIYGAKELCF